MNHPAMIPQSIRDQIRKEAEEKHKPDHDPNGYDVKTAERQAHIEAAEAMWIKCNEWVKCSERLPVEDGEDDGDYVLVHTRWNSIEVGKKSWRQGWQPNHWLLKSGHELEMDDITHWKPLPRSPHE